MVMSWGSTVVEERGGKLVGQPEENIAGTAMFISDLRPG